jgi:hypothetical protein
LLQSCRSPHVCDTITPASTSSYKSIPILAKKKGGEAETHSRAIRERGDAIDPTELYHLTDHVRMETIPNLQQKNNMTYLLQYCKIEFGGCHA